MCREVVAGCGMEKEEKTRKGDRRGRQGSGVRPDRGSQRSGQSCKGNAGGSQVLRAARPGSELVLAQPPALPIQTRIHRAAVSAASAVLHLPLAAGPCHDSTPPNWKQMHRPGGVARVGGSWDGMGGMEQVDGWKPWLDEMGWDLRARVAFGEPEVHSLPSGNGEPALSRALLDRDPVGRF